MIFTTPYLQLECDLPDSSNVEDCKESRKNIFDQYPSPRLAETVQIAVITFWVGRNKYSKTFQFFEKRI